MRVILDLSRNQLGARCKTMLLTAAGHGNSATNRSLSHWSPTVLAHQQHHTLLNAWPRAWTARLKQQDSNIKPIKSSKIDPINLVCYMNSPTPPGFSFIAHHQVFPPTDPHLDSAWRCWYGTPSMLPSLVHGNHHGQ